MNNTIQKEKKSALVVEGGGMRGVFSAGVLNSFGVSDYDPFDLYIGVSAGACNLASHLGGQFSRNFDISIKYSATSKFINPFRFLSGGHYMDLDWLWDITIRECRLDLDKIFRSLDEGGKEYIVTATALETGEPLYLKPDKSTLEHYIKISSSLPVLYRNILTAGEVAALDGGIADPVPVVEAYNRGARDITVIRSRPSGYVKEQGLVSVLYPYIFGKYPGLVRAMKKRHKVYMDAVRFINNPPDGVKVFEIAPPENLSIGRTTRNINSLNEAYIAGIKAGRRFVEAGIAVHEIT